MSLHRTLTLFMVVLAIVALTAAVSLVLLTTHLHRATVDLEAGLHSVRLAEEMQIDLLERARSSDDLRKARLENDLRNKLIQARQYVNSPDEAAALTEASRSIEGAADLEQAVIALQRFVDINIAQAEDALQASERWDQMGDWIGMGSGAALAIAVVAMLVWIRVFAFRPVFEIRDAMRGFGKGSKAARAPERGPEELRSIAAQFNDMANSLARQHEDQLRFLAAVAHDLRNPLSALKMASDIFSSDREVAPEKRAELMAVVKRQVHQLDRMVGDLLDQARIEGGHIELRFKEHDARTIAQSAFDLYHASSTGHQFALQLPSSQVIISCDALRIEQVLNNLISNAIKYSPKGGTIEVGVEQRGEHVVFRVSDQGIGIAESELPSIFEPFRRLRTSKEEIPGVGLGLSVAQRIAQAHGGRIEAESRIGVGTTFRVYLPVTAEKESRAS